VTWLNIATVARVAFVGPSKIAPGAITRGRVYGDTIPSG